jgi:primosomal protein N''
MSNQSIFNHQLQNRLEHEINALEQRIKQLNISEENFSDWFDAQLFNAEASQPLDYVHELRQTLVSLTKATTTSRSQWLSERLAHQLGALHQALRWFESHR